MNTKKYSVIVGTALLAVAIIMIGYFIPRENFIAEVSFFSLGVAGLALVSKNNNDNLTFYLGLALRVALLFSVPILSDDYFRFLWDGFLTNEGINPFDFKPSELAHLYESNNFAKELLLGMNSPNYYSIYPPVNQWMFFLASKANSTFAGIIILRLIIIGFEIGTYFVIIDLFKRFKTPLSKISLYWLNPLVILELSGNLHGEGILVFFLLSALLSLSKLEDVKGGVLLALSFCSKLFSLMFLPLLLLKGGKYRWKKLLIAAIPLLILLFVPFLDFSNLLHYAESLRLYFQSFEFNGSTFNLVKWIGMKTHGHDIIFIAGPVLSFISGIIILIISWKYRFRNRKVIFTGLTLMITTYFLCSPIVHPWYTIIPLAIGLITNLRFPLAWSLLAFLSYSFYDKGLNPNVASTLILVEYLAVFSLLYLDVKKLRQAY